MEGLHHDGRTPIPACTTRCDGSRELFRLDADKPERAAERDPIPDEMKAGRVRMLLYTVDQRLAVIISEYGRSGAGNPNGARSGNETRRSVRAIRSTTGTGKCGVAIPRS